MGFDVHQLVEGRDLWLGGIKIPHSMGLQGHSDADVLVHAISDALLGAANLRDIGYHFPDTSDKTLNMDSKIILKGVVDLLAEKGYHIGNIDATLCAERPKINPHVPAMRACLAQVMGIDEDQISIKATTTEHLGFTGREEGMSAYAVCLIEKECRFSGLFLNFAGQQRQDETYFWHFPHQKRRAKSGTRCGTLCCGAQPFGHPPLRFPIY